MLLLTLSLLAFCPNVGDPLINPPPMEEVLAYFEANPLPIEMTKNMFSVDDFHLNTAALIQGVDETQIKQLIEDSSAQQRALGLVAAMTHKTPNHLKYLLAAIDDESPIRVAKPMDRLKTLSDLVCHWFDLSLTRYENQWFTGTLLALTEPEVVTLFDAYLSCALPRHRDLLLTRHAVPARFENPIRELAEAGNTAALAALARFKNPDDIAWLTLSLEPDDAEDPAWLAAATLPDPAYLPAIEAALKKVLSEQALPLTNTYLIDALLAQDPAATDAMTADFFDGLDLKRPTHTKLLFDYFKHATRFTAQVSSREALLLHAMRRFHIMNGTSFSYFAGQSKALENELLESLWPDPLMIYTEEDLPAYLNVTLFMWIEDPAYLARLKVTPGHRKANHPHVQPSWYAQPE